jgi:heme-degrading monooxygenase HmoA
VTPEGAPPGGDDAGVFVHLAIHRPRPGREEALAASMARFGAPAHGMPGFRFHAALRDPDAGVLVGITIWDSKEDWEAAVPRQRKAVEGENLDELWDRPPEVFHLEPTGGPGNGPRSSDRE